MTTSDTCVLIGGCPRSGTTALMMSLNSNPCAYISSEENIIKKLEKLKKIFSSREANQTLAEQRLTKNSDTQDGRMRATSIRENWKLADVLPYHFSTQFGEALMLEAYQLHHAALHPGKTMTLFGDKAPFYYRSIQDFAALPWRVRYIHITRNPLDVINSMLRRVEKTKQKQDWWEGLTNIKDMVKTWNQAFEAICAHENRDDVLHIQYEDLIFEPEKTYGAIRQFIGIPSLQFTFPLVTDITKHFDRSYLDEKSIAHIYKACHLTTYKSYLRQFACGAQSLRSLE